MQILGLPNAVGSGETVDIEFKSAKGGVPKSLWETYSAMANTDGGTIILGVEDKGATPYAVGVSDVEKKRKKKA